MRVAAHGFHGRGGGGVWWRHNTVIPDSSVGKQRDLVYVADGYNEAKNVLCSSYAYDIAADACSRTSSRSATIEQLAAIGNECVMVTDKPYHLS